MAVYSDNAEPSTLKESLREAGAANPMLYPIWSVDAEGVCTCLKGATCGSPGKHPMSRNGIKDASSDPFEIAEMFSARPGCNPGLATGRESGVVVLDWDEIGCGGSLRRFGRLGRLPDTRWHRSGSGNLHQLYAFPPDLGGLPSRAFPEFDCELKADGAGVLLPPSRTNFGKYTVLNDAPLAPLPTWVVELAASLTVHEGGGKGATKSRFALPETIREGARAKTLFRFGCSLRANGHDHAEILAELRRVNAERCVPPMGDAEVRGRARSAARYEKGNAASAVTPETLEALAAIEASVLGATWTGAAEESEYSVMVALVRDGRLHGSLIPAGVRVSLDFRSLGLAAGVGKSTANRAAHRLRQRGWLRFDNLDRATEHSGAFVMLAPTPRTLGHSTTPSMPSGGRSTAGETKSVNVPPSAPRLRRGGPLGKRCEKVLDALERHGGKMRLGALATAVGTKRRRDLLRRTVKPLAEAGVVEYDEAADTVCLRDGWMEALDRTRTMSGEKKAENLDRAEYERQREAFRQHLAEQRSDGRKEERP